MKRIFSTGDQSVITDLLLLLIRVIVGYVFIRAGWDKIQHPLNWMGPTSGFPGFFQALAAIAEYCGGIALILGFLTRIAAFGIACTMVTAVYMLRFVWSAPFISPTGGIAYVLPLILLLIVLVLLNLGAGRFSVDWLLSGRRARTAPAF
jgi:putative oxidoreductase